jgi:hypothetical protein
MMKLIMMSILLLSSTQVFAANKNAIDSAMVASASLMNDISSISAVKDPSCGSASCFIIEIVGMDANQNKTVVSLSVTKGSGDADYVAKILTQSTPSK